MLLTLVLVAVGCHVDGSAAEPRVGESRIVAEFDFDLDCGVILVPVTIRSRTFAAVFDTGSNRTMFDASLKPLMGKDRGRALGSAPDGSFAAELFEPPEATVAGVELGPLPVVSVVDLRPAREAIGEPVYGIIGMDFLAKYVVQIDFDSRKVRLADSVRGPSGQRMRLRFTEGRVPLVSARLGDSYCEDFFIDSGCSGAGGGTIEAAVFSELVTAGEIIRSYSVGSTTLSRTKERRAGSLKTFSLHAFKHSSLDFSESGRSALGIAYLARYQVTLDFPGSAIYLLPRDCFQRIDPRDVSGLSLAYINNRVFVRRVAESSPADMAGVRAGDIILRIDGKEAADTHLTVIRRILSMDGATRELTLRRGLRNIDVVLELRDWRVYHGGATKTGSD